MSALVLLKGSVETFEVCEDLFLCLHLILLDGRAGLMMFWSVSLSSILSVLGTVDQQHLPQARQQTGTMLQLRHTAWSHVLPLEERVSAVKNSGSTNLDSDWHSGHYCRLPSLSESTELFYSIMYPDMVMKKYISQTFALVPGYLSFMYPVRAASRTMLTCILFQHRAACECFQMCT